MSTLTSVVVFEGAAYLPDEKRFRATQINNQADELDRIKPSGDYSGRTDEIISSLISDYCNYVTAGTLATGTAMGTITFSGDKTLRRILHEFAEIDGFTWYLKPQGQLFYDDGTLDTGVDISSDDAGSTKPFNVDAFYQNTGINAVIVRGAYIAGVQIISAKQSDAQDILLNGETLIYVTDGNVNTIPIGNIKALAILNRDGVSPLTARFSWRNTTVGLPQKGQSITLKNDTTDINITEAQYILDRIDYDGKTDEQAIECSSGLVFRIGSETERLPEENSQLISQLGGSVETNISDIASIVSDVAFAESWDAVTDIAPSKNVVYDKLLAIIADYESYLAIGAANARTIPCIREGASVEKQYSSSTVSTYRNDGSIDHSITVGIPLPLMVGTKKLYINTITIGVEDADATNYIDRVYFAGWDAYDNSVVLNDDTTNRTSAGEYDYTFTAVDCSSYLRLFIQIFIVCTASYDLDIPYVLVNYYYDD